MAMYVSIHKSLLGVKFPNSVSIQFDDNQVTIDGRTFTMDDFKSKLSGFEPLCRYVFKYVNGVLDELADPYEILSLTSVGRRNPKDVTYENDTAGAVTVVFTPETTTLRDAVWRVILVEDGEGNAALSTNGDVVSSVRESEAFGSEVARFSWKPSFNVSDTTVTADGYVDLPVTYVAHDGSTPAVSFLGRVKSDAGYLPKTALKFVDGVAMCRVGAIGLNAGDVITVKFGIGDYSAIATAQVTVV